MLADRIEAKWIDAFCEIFERCAVKPGDTAAILSETQSRALNVHIAELALLRMGAKPFHIVVPTPRNKQVVPVRSTGASEAIQRLAPVVSALQQAGFVVDCTIEGLMHAPETPEILEAGARILVINAPTIYLNPKYESDFLHVKREIVFVNQLAVQTDCKVANDGAEAVDGGSPLPSTPRGAAARTSRAAWSGPDRRNRSRRSGSALAEAGGMRGLVPLGRGSHTSSRANFQEVNGTCTHGHST